MPDILLTRIDNRLVHGQVGVAWTSALNGVNLIVVADDLAAADPLQQSLMTATARNAGCGIRFFTLDKTIAVIHKASASQHIFLVVRDPQGARKLVEGGVPSTSSASGTCMWAPARPSAATPTSIWMSATRRTCAPSAKRAWMSTFRSPPETAGRTLRSKRVLCSAALRRLQITIKRRDHLCKSHSCRAC